MNILESYLQSVQEGKFTLPPNHRPAFKVPKGGSSCANCKFLQDNACTSKNFIEWKGDGKIPFAADEYCSDWYEPKEGAVSEGYRTSMTKRGRQQKTKSTAGTIATSLARKRNDPQYKKMIYFKQQYIKQKKQLQQRYKSKALALARQKAQKYK